MDHQTTAAELDKTLASLGTAERAAHVQRYLKSSLTHYGTRVPIIDTAVKDWSRQLRPLEHDDVVGLTQALWAEPVHERRVAAVKLLKANVDTLTSGDLPLVERLLRECKTWALLDELAVHVAGPILDHDPRADRIIERWAADDDFWIRRAALLAHLNELRAGRGDWDRFARLADGMLEEREFFIRKAIGWVLRDTSRRRPDLVSEWILPRAGRASGVTVREAVKRLPTDQVNQVMAAYRG